MPFFHKFEDERNHFRVKYDSIYLLWNIKFCIYNLHAVWKIFRYLGRYKMGASFCFLIHKIWLSRNYSLSSFRLFLPFIQKRYIFYNIEPQKLGLLYFDLYCISLGKTLKYNWKAVKGIVFLKHAIYLEQTIHPNISYCSIYFLELFFKRCKIIFRY